MRSEIQMIFSEFHMTFSEIQFANLKYNWHYLKYKWKRCRIDFVVKITPVWIGFHKAFPFLSGATFKLENNVINSLRNNRVSWYTLKLNLFKANVVVRELISLKHLETISIKNAVWWFIFGRFCSQSHPTADVSI
jgi:hypothetical protein